jgi:hypothetical protein
MYSSEWAHWVNICYVPWDSYTGEDGGRFGTRLGGGWLEGVPPIRAFGTSYLPAFHSLRGTLTISLSYSYRLNDTPREDTIDRIGAPGLCRYPILTVSQHLEPLLAVFCE